MAYFHQEGEWREAHIAWGLVSRCTGHKIAQLFRAHGREMGLPELPLSSMRHRREKILLRHQVLHGGLGAKVTGFMVTGEGMDKALRKAWNLFKKGTDGEDAPSDYKGEILQLIIDLYSRVDRAADELRLLGQMAAKGFNDALDARRIYVNSVGLRGKAKEKLAKLQPADAKLFGGKVGELFDAMKDEGRFQGKLPRQYFSQYTGGKGVLEGATGGGFRQRRVASRNRGSIPERTGS